MKDWDNVVRYWVLDANNHPVPADSFTWAIWFGTDSNRRVGFTQITSEVHVSTVFLGLNHRFVGDGPPLLFESMVFGGAEDGNQWRYSSWDDAKAGHDATVSRLRRKQRELQHGSKVDTGNV